jgi:hypothetical protein
VLLSQFLYRTLELWIIQASAEHVEQIKLIVDGSPGRADTEVVQQLPSMFSVSSLEITKARVRTAKKERRRSRTYRDKIIADREVKHDD